MKKTLFTLAVDDYAPEITALTFPFMQRYAEKIGAEFYVIRDRKFPDMPVTYEKFQIHQLGRDMGNDWNLYFDADTFIHPDMFDVTEQIGKDTVFHNGVDMRGIRFKANEYFRRDGRNISSCTWCFMCSDWCLDLVRPTELPLEDVLSNITPTLTEMQSGLYDPHHFIDDYLMSCNIARFGLKVEIMSRLVERLGMPKDCSFLHHSYTQSQDEKAKTLLGMLEHLKLLDMTKPELTFTI